MGAYWHWVSNILVPGLRAGNWYNGKRAFGVQGFLADFNNRLIGFAIMRQVRIKPNTCL
jgi:hypothetical protein